MRLIACSLSVLGIAAASDAGNLLIARQSTSESDYLNSVCSPNITSTTNPIPPCIEIQAIQEGCSPNGTAPIDLLAHAQCMCNGGYFANWIGCLDCEYVHGGRSPQLTSAFHTIITSASNELCTGTPTASFAAIFNSIQDNNNPGDATETLSDQFPSQTAVSLYYTASGAQGLGAITGSATLATRTPAPSTSSAVSGGASTGTTSSSTGAGSSTSTTQPSTSSSKAGVARQTGFAIGGLAAMAGAALAIAL